LLKVPTRVSMGLSYVDGVVRGLVRTVRLLRTVRLRVHMKLR
jgi:hypothetical protein